MKKLLQMMTAMGLIFVLSTGFVFADVNSQTVNLVVGQSTAQINGKNTAMPAPAQVIEGRTLVPLRFISEAFGCEVEWESSTKTAMVFLENESIEIPIGEHEVWVNGWAETIEVPAQLINGNTYVPLRFISESLGAEVQYDAGAKRISVVMNAYQNEALGCEMILPNGWVVLEETAEDVTFVGPEDYVLMVTLFDDSEEYTDDSFRSMVEVVFSSYGMKEDFACSTEVDGLATASFSEDEKQYYITFRLLDNGNVYSILMGHRVGSDDITLYNQSDLLNNTVKPYTQ